MSFKDPLKAYPEFVLIDISCTSARFLWRIRRAIWWLRGSRRRPRRIRRAIWWLWGPRWLRRRARRIRPGRLRRPRLRPRRIRSGMVVVVDGGLWLCWLCHSNTLCCGWVSRLTARLGLRVVDASRFFRVVMRIKDTTKERSNGNKAASTDQKRICTNSNNTTSPPLSLTTHYYDSHHHHHHRRRRRCVYYPVNLNNNLFVLTKSPSAPYLSSLSIFKSTIHLLSRI